MNPPSPLPSSVRVRELNPSRCQFKDDIRRIMNERMRANRYVRTYANRVIKSNPPIVNRYRLHKSIRSGRRVSEKNLRRGHFRRLSPPPHPPSPRTPPSYANTGIFEPRSRAVRFLLLSARVRALPSLVVDDDDDVDDQLSFPRFRRNVRATSGLIKFSR